VPARQGQSAQRTRYVPMSHPDKGGLLDRVAAFRLVESVWKGVFFCFFVVQRSMDGYLPSKRRRDHQAQKMSLFFFYIVIFSSVLKAHRLTLPHGLVARRPGIFGLTGCDVHRRRPGKPTTVTVLPKKKRRRSRTCLVRDIAV